MEVLKQESGREERWGGRGAELGEGEEKGWKRKKNRADWTSGVGWNKMKVAMRNGQ